MSERHDASYGHDMDFEFSRGCIHDVKMYRSLDDESRFCLEVLCMNLYHVYIIYLFIYFD